MTTVKNKAKSKKDTSDVAGEFGFHFQTDAAIYLMSEYLCKPNFKGIRMEGIEDIDLLFDDSQIIIAQAKSILKPQTDFKNVLGKLSSAIRTLSLGNKKAEKEGKNISKYIYITNSPDPFKDGNFKGIFYDEEHLKYEEIPIEDDKNKIKEYWEKENKEIDLTKLEVIILPFWGNDIRRREEKIYKQVDNFVGKLKIKIPGMTQDLLQKWMIDVFENGTKFADGKMISNGRVIKHPRKKHRSLNKNEIIWPVILLIMDKDRKNDSFYDKYSEEDYDYFMFMYMDVIKDVEEHTQLSLKILGDFEKFRKGYVIPENTYKRDTERELEDKFIELFWNDYVALLGLKGIKKEDRKDLVQIILYKVLSNKRLINDVKKATYL